MAFLSKLRNWQKGVLFSLVFVMILSGCYVASLIFLDFNLSKKGAPHMCFMLSEKVECSFEEAIESRMAFFFVLLLVFGIPVTVFGGIVGYLIDKIGISP